jgi:DNA-binding NarL/FixJ family response regulator
MTISVLVADDHAVMRDGLRLILEAQEGFHVVAEASNGRDAVELASEHKPGAAVLDVAMPELNGIEAAREICRLSPSTKVIILSMHGTAEHIFRALEAGASGYLLKESAGREVVHAIREVLAGRRYLTQSIEETVLEDYIRHRAGAASEGPLSALSPREREVLQLVVEGRSSKEIGRIVHISAKTVDTYRSRLMRKLGVRDLTALVRFAVAHGISPEA